MDTRTALDREAKRFELRPDAFERLLRRRDRKERNRRVSAAVLAIVLTLLSTAGMMRAFRNSGRPAIEPSPSPVDTGIFSGMGGWIAYGNADGIWAVDPERPGHPEAQIRLSTFGGLPLAWSRDGSKLLIRTHRQHALAVLNADGTETLLVEVGVHDWLSGGSFSPDGSKVVYASGPFYRSAPDGIYVVDAAGGKPRRLLAGVRRLGNSERSWLSEATFSPDGSQIAYIDGMHDHSNTLRVMNADGTGSHVLLEDTGVMRTQAFLEHLVWSPDGTHLAFDFEYAQKIYVVGADGSGLLAIADGVNPAWSPDGSRISYAQPLSTGGLVIADADGTHVQRFHYGGSGPWNPLPHASGHEAPKASARTGLDARLLWGAVLLALGAALVAIRRRKRSAAVA